MEKPDDSDIEEILRRVKHISETVDRLAERVEQLMAPPGQRVTVPSGKLRDLTILGPFTLKVIETCLKNGEYTRELYADKINGLVDFFKPLICRDKKYSYVCTDKVRIVCFRVIETGEWKRDYKGEYFSKALEAMKPHVEKHHRKMNRDPLLKEFHDNMVSPSGRQKLLTELRARLMAHWSI